MALPAGVTTCTLTFGPYTDAQGAVVYAGMSADITPSAPMRHAASGTRIPATPIRITIGDDGTASAVLPHTDQASIKPMRGLSLTYEVRWIPQRNVQGTPGNKRIALPQAVGDTTDFESLEPSPDVPGVLVPIAVSMDLVEQIAQSATDVQAGAATAGTKAGQAQVSAADARDAARDSQVAAETAANTVTAAQTAAAAAAVDASAAETAAAEAAASAANAALDASQAETWASEAAASAASADARAAAAEASATNAATTVTAAATEAQAAKGAASTAAGSAAAAKDVADQARADSDQAKQVAAAAQANANSAATSASNAALDAASASSRANAAETAATSAATNANYASNQAAAAAESAAGAAVTARTVLRSATIDANGHLILIDSDNRMVDAGVVLGPKGDKGDQGVKGDVGDLTPSDYLATWGGTADLTSWSVPSTKVRTLSGNVTISSLPANPGPNKAGTVSMVIRQSSLGVPFSVTWPATLEWSGDAPAPAMPTAPNSEMVVHLFWSGQAWRAMLGGIYFP